MAASPGSPIVIVSYDAPPEHLLAISDSLPAAHIVVLRDIAEDHERRRVLRLADVVLAWHWQRELSPSDVTQLERASFVQFLSSGVDHVRFEEIPASIAVAGNAGGYAQAMAEHAVAMMLSLAKRLSAWNEAMARGDFAQDEARTTRLSGKTACVLGLGGVGAAVSGIAYAMGMRVVGVNRTGSSQLHGLSKVSAWSSLDEELPGADVLMIALPLTRATRGCFDSRRLSLMKSDAILVNVGRAEIVDERALFSHLLGNPDFRAGIDVWWREPFKDGYVDACSLMPRLSNVLATPHVAARVEDGLLDGARCAAENIRRFLAGSRPHGLVNRDDY